MAASQLAIDSFTTNAKSAYESGSKLRPTVRTDRIAKGKSHRFDGIGRVRAYRPVPGQDVRYVNPPVAKPTADLEERWSFVPLTLQDERLLQVGYAADIGRKTGTALGRAWDGMIIQALNTFNADALKRNGQTANDSHTTADSQVVDDEDIRTAVTALKRNGVDTMVQRCYIVIDAQYYGGLAGAEFLASRDYVNGSVTETGKLPMAYGCTFIFIDGRAREDMEDGQMPENKAFVYADDAVGLALTGEEIGIREYRADTRTWQYGAAGHGGAVQIDATGVYHIDIKA